MTSLADLLRLLALPAFGWIALRDYRTRRVPSEAWYPLAALGIGLLAWEGLRADGLYLRRAAFGIAFLLPFAGAAWWFGLFGRADAKAIAVLAVLFPTYPAYELGATTLPIVETRIGVFSITILTNAVLVAAVYPLGLAARNLLRGRLSPAMFVGVPIEVDDLLAVHGKLLETPEGFAFSGLDLDALRMYLRWRGLALEDLRKRPGAFRRPATLPADPNAPTDGAVDPGADPEPGGTAAAGFRDPDQDDPWGAATFLDSIEGSAYGTTPERLREGLDLLAERETVWVSPGIPFLVPLFLGLLVSFTVGDVLFAALGALGIV